MRLGEVLERVDHLEDALARSRYGGSWVRPTVPNGKTLHANLVRDIDSALLKLESSMDDKVNKKTQELQKIKREAKKLLKEKNDGARQTLDSRLRIRMRNKLA